MIRKHSIRSWCASFSRNCLAPASHLATLARLRLPDPIRQILRKILLILLRARGGDRLRCCFRRVCVPIAPLDFVLLWSCVKIRLQGRSLRRSQRLSWGQHRHPDCCLLNHFSIVQVSFLLSLRFKLLTRIQNCLWSIISSSLSEWSKSISLISQSLTTPLCTSGS